MRTRRAELVRYKDARRKGQDVRPQMPKSKKEKPVILEFRYTKKWKGPVLKIFAGWHRFGKYQNERIAETIARTEMRKLPGYYEFRLHGRCTVSAWR